MERWKLYVRSKNGIAMNIAVAAHHAYSQQGEAFCMLNDQANWALDIFNLKN